MDSSFPVEVGIALLPSAGIEVLTRYDGLYDFVQVMGIARIGFQGEPFDDQALALVRKLREQYSDMVIQVDGAVSMDNIRALVDAGASRLVVGSAIFRAEDPVGAVKQLRAAANKK